MKNRSSKILIGAVVFIALLLSFRNNAKGQAPGITVNPTADLITTEDGGTDTFTVVLDTEPTENVTIGVSSSNTEEGTVAPASLTFDPNNWDDQQTVTITGVNDDVDDGDVTYTILTAAAVSDDVNYNTLDPNDVSVKNTDNDTAGLTVNPTADLITTEDGGTDTFTVVLDTEPTENVTIGVSSSNTEEGTVAPASLTFDPNNWDDQQTVTITGVDDDVDDGDMDYTILTAPAVSDDANYNNLDPNDISVTNTDNDGPGITVNAPAGLTTTEGGGTATFTVVLDTEPTADVTINLSSNTPTEGTIDPNSLTFDPNNWDDEQTVTITGVDDDKDDGNVTYKIITSASESEDPKYDNLDPADVTVKNLDNDGDDDDDDDGCFISRIRKFSINFGLFKEN